MFEDVRLIVNVKEKREDEEDDLEENSSNESLVEHPPTASAGGSPTSKQPPPISPFSLVASLTGYFPAGFNVKGFLAALSYGTISMTIVFFNKAVLTSYQLRRPNLLSLFQLVLTVATLAIGKSQGLVQFPSVSREVLVRCLPVACWSLLNVLAGLFSTQLLTVPMLSVLRRTATLFVIVGDRIFLGKAMSQVDVVSVVWWIAGGAVSAWGDVYFSFWGYVAVTVNGIATAGFYISTARVNKIERLDSTTLLFYNSLLSIPFQVVVFLASGERHGLEDFPFWTDAGFQFFLWGTMVQAAMLNYFIFLCSSLCGPTVTSITGQIKTVVQSFLGVFLFSVAMDNWGWAGMTISTIGCIYYCYRKVYPDTTPAAIV